MNERKTEALVRNHFNLFTEDVVIEEQSSSDPRIQKLLATASKAGSGCGRPEFIIQVLKQPNFLIVVECKADTFKHESPNRDKYKDYAVDGAILYSSYLTKDFDVLSIAVSGEDEKHLKVSHFLGLKGERKYTQMFDNKLLSVKDYVDGYIKSPEKFRQDYSKLLDFSKELNDKLHGFKIAEGDRGLLISCILIALENKSFAQTYQNYLRPEDLSKYLVDVAEMEFKNANIPDRRLNILKSRFDFIRTDTSLSSIDGVLCEIITDIKNNIKDFIQTHEYFDVLGQLYIEFLRYANSDKGLGIVLTPPHITEFMAELSEVNKQSVVYDNCTGTGGFLVSAMNLMIKDAKGDLDRIKNIKRNQLIGVEFQAHIFALACSNMFIHQDGKSNILKGSCFDDEIIKEVKSYKPTVGLLNPPYKSDKKKDTDELEFILSNLDCLEQGGKCVAIVPMQSALAQNGKVLDYKKKILEQHTLEAVFSMPDELFFNSKVGVVSCIMVFTAKRPHPLNKKTFFGYYKNDGFVKRKGKGRYDAYNTWKDVKEKWITVYQNKENVPSLSVNKVVTANDEWCAEAYMDTDYALLNEQMFNKTILNHVAFKLLSGKLRDVVYSPMSSKKLVFDTTNWKSFKLDDLLFNITGSKTTPLLELEEYGEGNYPYVTTQATNNGVEGFYNYYSEEGNVLVVDSAVLGYCSYQPYSFSASDHVEKLIPKFSMNAYTAVFLVSIINMERYRYNYGRKCSQDRMKQRSIMLPVKEGLPDFEFMANYIKSLPYSKNL